MSALLADEQRATVVDLFAGPGGWDIAARELGLDPLGIELDDAACQTREAAGLRTLQADVAALAPRAFAPVAGLIASAPCPTFSSAGSGGGRLLTEIIVRCMGDLVAGRDTRQARRDEAYELLEPIYWAAEREKARKKRKRPDRDASRTAARRDADMSLLVVEPLRWALALEPTWIALEQVPPVIELWEHLADMLRRLGYSAWCGILNAADFGVPQTRKRAFLLAHRHRPALPPERTHCKGGAPPSLTCGGLEPWVTMAVALGWTGLTATQRNGATGEYGERCGDEPAFTVVPNADRWHRPAPTVTGGGTGSGGGVEVFAGKEAREVVRQARAAAAPVAYNRRDQRDGRTGKLHPHVPVNEPLPTIAGQSRNDTWVFDRPATTVCADPRIPPPGWRGNPEDYADGNPTRSGDNAVRVTLEEAAVLQGFPRDYPWQGTRSKRFEQVGNAVPPTLARATLGALVVAADRREAA